MEHGEAIGTWLVFSYINYSAVQKKTDLEIFRLVKEWKGDQLL